MLSHYMVANLITFKRNVIFISHATPQDNDFTIWLASRLQADGYEVWIDKQALLGGEKFWQEIDQVIRHKAIKFLLVYSENICQQKRRGIIRDGVEKEKSLAESIAKANNLNDFIVLLNIDGSEYNLFIGADTLNQILFFENWAGGYTQLLKKFKKAGFEPSSTLIEGFSRWYEDEYVIHNGIQKMPEIYYDSWWPIPELPPVFYIYVFSKESEAFQVQQQSKYPVGKATNIIAAFHDIPYFEIEADEKVERINFENKYEVKVKDVLLGVRKEGFPNTRDVENHLRSLLQRIFHMIMRDRGLSWHNMANKKLAYYFTRKTNPKITFEYRHRSKKKIKHKKIFGKHLNSFWHFALSAKPVLTPQLAYSLKSHLVFTTDGYKLLDNPDKMHSARRQKGRLFFNEEWRDMLFAFLHGLCGSKKTVRIDISPSFVLALRPWTNIYQSDFGYIEPNEKDRHNILEIENDYYDRENELDDENG